MPARNPLRELMRRIVNFETDANYLDGSTGRVGCATTFAKLPADVTVAAANDPLTVFDDSTNAVVVTRADKGGVTLTTANADGDVGGLRGVANTYFASFKISNESKPFFKAKVMLSNVTTPLFSIGWDENVADPPNPDPAASAGDGVCFQVDPTGESATGSGSTFWQVHEKVDGADTLTTTTVTATADQEYELELSMGTDLKVRCYIDNVLVHTTAALTDGDALGCYAAIEATTTDEPAFECRYWSFSKIMGVA